MGTRPRGYSGDAGGCSSSSFWMSGDRRRFSDYLTDLGRRSLREGIPTDGRLFPHHLNTKIKSEHDHKASTSKLICKPKAGPKPWTGSQSFRDSASFRRGQQSGADRKRKWAYKPRGSSAKYSKNSEVPDESQIPPSRLANSRTWLSIICSSPFHFTNSKENRNFLNKLEITLNGQMNSSSCFWLPFLRPPHQWRTRPTVVQEGQSTELMKGAIQALISKGAISVVDPCPQQFISTLFLLEKGSGTGEFRPVINLKALNRFLAKKKFKMDGALLREND